MSWSRASLPLERGVRRKGEYGGASEAVDDGRQAGSPETRVSARLAGRVGGAKGVSRTFALDGRRKKQPALKPVGGALRC
jgi:hypothetical protein